MPPGKAAVVGGGGERWGGGRGRERESVCVGVRVAVKCLHHALAVPSHTEERKGPNDVGSLLGIVPSAADVVKEQRHKDTRHGAEHQVPRQRLQTNKHETNKQTRQTLVVRQRDRYAWGTDRLNRHTHRICYR